jgi:probable rRNA maturation factor
MKHLQLRNRQRDRTIKLPVLRQISTALLEELLNFSNYELAIHFVSPRTMADLNEKFLNHTGPTDVITFDFREGYDPVLAQLNLAGEIYICLAVADKQASEFSTTWPEEVARYIVHGVLHLIGHDDLVPDKRRIMKREENRLLEALSRRFDFSEISR